VLPKVNILRDVEPKDERTSAEKIIDVLESWSPDERKMAYRFIEVAHTCADALGLFDKPKTECHQK
jgi:hypothetical protein